MEVKDHLIGTIGTLGQLDEQGRRSPGVGCKWLHSHAIAACSE